ncbi:MAG: response regulator [Caulobacterales bacterium]|nr:response regulator [Caulobacterales bacterium]
MALAVAAALIVLGACAALLVYADNAIDHITLVHEAELMRQVIDREVADVTEDVVAEGIWTEAYERTALRFDPEWTHANFGTSLHDVRQHHRTVIFDGADRAIYLAVDGRMVPTDADPDFVRASRPLLAAVRAESRRLLAANPRAEGQARQGVRSGALRAGSRLYLAGASSIVPEPGYRGPITAEAVVVSARVVGPQMLQDFHTAFGLMDVRLVADGAHARPSAPLLDLEGRRLGALTWRPQQPGQGAMLAARWQILGAALCVVGAVVLLVMRLRRLAREVTAARDRAEAGDRAKSEFIANMSHEIRTPLNGVLGMAQVMSGDELSVEQRQRLGVIRDSGSSLLSILNDVLDFSKIEAGRLTLIEGPFDAAELAQKVCSTFEGMAAAKDLQLRLEVDPAARGIWMGDALRIRQMLSNLVSNAVKFTGDGSVSLSVMRMPEGLVFAVSDTGVGLDASKIPELFEKFSQVDPTLTRRHGGAGLGLSITRGLLRLMGGDIAVSSQPGQGSCFTLALPLRRAHAPAADEQAPVAAPKARPSSGGPPRVLAAEDNLTNQYVLRALLEPLDLELTLVGDGREAVDAFEAQAFDLILMDVQMPELNGVDATRAIRALEAASGRSRTPIVAMTANVMSHQLEGYRLAGMDAHVAKPVDVAALYAVLDQALSGELGAQAAAA